MSKFSYVSYLDVNLSSGSDRASIYANSTNGWVFNQIAVTINFIVTDEYYQQVILTNEEIKQCIFLGDYHTGEVISSNPSLVGWAAITEAFDYVTSDVTQNYQAPQAIHQSITYYVSCNDYIARSCTFCAVATPDNGASIVTGAKGTEFDNGITLTSLPAIYYDCTQFDFSRVDTQSKTYGKHAIDQDNYYASIPGVTFKNDWYEDSPVIYERVNADGNHPALYQMIFSIGPQGTYDLTLSDGTVIPMSYNDRAGQICLSRITIQNYSQQWVDKGSAYIKVMDIYGNIAYLHFTPSDDNNTISMSNA
ncbi:hypothetical protein [Citrobacter cronae]|uniref:hypothetical protein n=1 Tax=Citrobacter cronae TaxID=1748967 RepID=UPI0021D2D6D4|nr:hypothetical protein [Citrobacter cronae]MCU6173817.1 hypothetical protein [Citrobacter cronae]